MASSFVAAGVGGIATAEELLAAGDIGPCELVQGELVMMSPAGFEHGVVTQRIAALLHAHVSPRRLGVVTAAETGFVLARSPDTVRAPDVAFVSEPRLPRGRVVGFFEGSPDLAVEVLSPADLRDEAARGRAASKVRDWLAAGCLEAWSVDPGARTVTVHRSNAAVTFGNDSDAVTSLVLPGLVAVLADIFPPPAA